MRNKLPVLIFSVVAFAVMCAGFSSALNILVTTPANGSVIAVDKCEFIFNFDRSDGVENVLNCSVLLDGVQIAKRNTLIMTNNNKMTASVTPGTHTFVIDCVMKDGSHLQSPARTLTVNAEATSTKPYDMFYNSNGLRRYEIGLKEGKESVELPAMKGGEEMDFKIGSKVYYVDVLRMGPDSVGGAFVEIRDRTHSNIVRVTIGGSVKFDFDDDKIDDVEIVFLSMERNVDAFFKIIHYPGSTAAPQIPTGNTTNTSESTTPEIPEETTGTGTTTPTETTPGDSTTTEPSETQTEPEDETESGSSSSATKSIFGPVLIGVIILAVIAIVLAFVFLGREPGSEKSSEKKKDAAKPSKTVSAKEKLKKEVEKEEADDEREAEEEIVVEEKPQAKKIEIKPESKVEPKLEQKKTEAKPAPKEEPAASTEKFDIIKSSGSGGRRRR